jgi:hypothetical protein
MLIAAAIFENVNLRSLWWNTTAFVENLVLNLRFLL